MTVFDIKIIAIVTMLIDHIGLAFFINSPYYFPLRLIGRLSFPLFAFLTANGAYYTRNINRYLLRLFVFALISQVPYLLFHRQYNPSFFKLNIFFTLFICLLIIVLFRNIQNKIIRALIVIAATVATELLFFEYGGVGLLVILIFYFFFKNIRLMFFTLLPLFLIVHVGSPMLEYINNGSVRVDLVSLFQPVAVLSILFISKYNHKEGKKLKYIFYFFYPLHLFILYMIKLFL